MAGVLGTGANAMRLGVGDSKALGLKAEELSRFDEREQALKVLIRV